MNIVYDNLCLIRTIRGRKERDRPYEGGCPLTAGKAARNPVVDALPVRGADKEGRRGIKSQVVPTLITASCVVAYRGIRERTAASVAREIELD